MTTTTPERMPVRERRRASVERIALDLAIDQGYDAITVDTICDAALISSSTFFNYFGSKERAVLGPVRQPFDPSRFDAFATGSGDTLTELMTALVADWPTTPEDRAVLLRRLRLTERTPALRVAHHARLEVASGEVERAARARLVRQGVEDPDDSARMIVDASHALMHWMIDRLRVDATTPWPDLIEGAVRTLRAVAAPRS